MRERIVALGLILTVSAIAAVVLLSVNFQLKQRRFEASTPSASAPSPPPPASAELGDAEGEPPEPPRQPILDGRISNGEYRYSYFDAQIHASLYWTIDEEAGVIYLGLVSPASGWIALSLAPTGPRMKGGDIVIGYVKDGQAFVRDDYAHEVVSHTADVELSQEGSDNILASAGSSGPSGTVIELSRPLVASDAYDKPISQDLMRAQIAYSEVADFSSYHVARAAIEINFYTGEVVPAPSEESP